MRQKRHRVLGVLCAVLLAVALGFIGCGGEEESEGAVNAAPCLVKETCPEGYRWDMQTCTCVVKQSSCLVKEKCPKTYRWDSQLCLCVLR